MALFLAKMILADDVTRGNVINTWLKIKKNWVIVYSHVKFKLSTTSTLGDRLG